MIKTYAYHILKANMDADQDGYIRLMSTEGQAFGALMNTMGAGGWELVSTITVGNVAFLIFKREVVTGSA